MVMEVFTVRNHLTEKILTVDDIKQTIGSINRQNEPEKVDAFTEENPFKEANTERALGKGRVVVEMPGAKGPPRN